MLTLEVHGQFITWPEEFALLMMKYYQKHGVTFIIHRHCDHAGWDTTAKDNRTAERTGPIGAFGYSGCDR
jgi:hypothetical protein